MSKHSLTFLFIFLFGTMAFSQQLPLFDNYLINPASLSPAFTGKYYKFQSLLTYRNEYTNLAGTPVAGNVYVDGAPHKNMGVGGNLLYNKAGIYRNFSLNLNYAYHLQVAKEHFLSFGINASLYQNSLDLSDIVTHDPNDPVINGYSKITETYFNAGLGLLYSWKELNVSLSVPLIFNNRSFYSDNTYQHLLAMDRNWLFYTNYTLDFHRDWKLKFDLLFRKNQYSPLIIDVSAMAKYRDNYWLGFLYRKPATFGIHAGVAIINKIVVNYTFEFSGYSMNGTGSGTHEISLGFRMFREGQQNLLIKDYVR